MLLCVCVCVCVGGWVGGWEGRQKDRRVEHASGGEARERRTLIAVGGVSLTTM